jgi:hypothetical protein
MGRHKINKPKRIKAVYGVVEVDGVPVTVRAPGDAPRDVLHRPAVAEEIVNAARTLRKRGNFDRVITLSRTGSSG